MPFISHNPATETILERFDSLDKTALAALLSQTHAAQREWRHRPFAQRAALLRALNHLLLAQQDRLAALITEEMGKPTREALSEIKRCAAVCLYYATEGEAFLTPQPTASDELHHSYISYHPIGVVLGVMPWNFPFWQVFRFAVPALMAGNGVAIKHAPNVPRCAAAIAEVMSSAGFPPHLITNLYIEDALVADAIASPHVQAVTLTGSGRAGRAVAALSGGALKKCILELGGSDPFVVLADADLEWAADQAITSRFSNCGQTCIAAKRFILLPQITDDFIALLQQKVAALKVGNPADPGVTIGPMARQDLRDNLQRQVDLALSAGAHCLMGGHMLPGPGWFYAPTLLDNITESSPAWTEELFGPVALIIRARDEMDSLRLANDTPYGLGSSVWGRNAEHAEQFAEGIEAGCTFVNGMVRSDPRLPFGGTKASGFGRELSSHGIREFTNIKTVWVKNG